MCISTSARQPAPSPGSMAWWKRQTCKPPRDKRKIELARLPNRWGNVRPLASRSMMAHRKNGLLHDQTAGRTGNEHTSLRADFAKTTRSLARNPSASDHGRRLVSDVFDLEALRGMAADYRRRAATAANAEQRARHGSLAEYCEQLAAAIAQRPKGLAARCADALRRGARAAQAWTGRHQVGPEGATEP
jgi:hypothetical protein